MTQHTLRLERYYNALVGRSRAARDLPSIREARRDLYRGTERHFPFYGP